MKEQILQTILGNYLRENPQNENAVYELKMSKNTSMPFSQVKEHQIKALLQAKNGNLFHKIADAPIFMGSRTRFNMKKPFDCLNMYQTKAFVVIVYYQPRKKKEFIFIDIDDFVEEIKISERKSLTEERAKVISSRII